MMRFVVVEDSVACTMSILKVSVYNNTSNEQINNVE